MVSSASSSTKNPPRKQARTTVIDISSNEAYPIQANNLIPTILTTTLALSLTPPNISQSPPNQPIEASPLAPRALVYSTPPSSLIPSISLSEETGHIKLLAASKFPFECENLILANAAMPCALWDIFAAAFKQRITPTTCAIEETCRK
ncbi:hypothetical protein Tco_0780793 [Tanacetum coccineum]